MRKAKVCRGNYDRKRWSSPDVLTAASVPSISATESETREMERATVGFEGRQGDRSSREYRKDWKYSGTGDSPIEGVSGKQSHTHLAWASSCSQEGRGRQD